jgi:5'-3' exonuclease
VDEKTIRRDAEFAKGLERLDPVFRKEVLNGKVKVEKTKIQKLGKASEELSPITSVDDVIAVYNQMVTTEQSKGEETQ